MNRPPTETRVTRRTVAHAALELSLLEERVRDLIREGVLPDLEDREDSRGTMHGEERVNCYECFARAAPVDREINARLRRSASGHGTSARSNATASPATSVSCSTSTGQRSLSCRIPLARAVAGSIRAGE